MRREWTPTMAELAWVAALSYAWGLVMGAWTYVLWGKRRNG